MAKLKDVPTQKGNPYQNYGKGNPIHPDAINQPPDYTKQPDNPAFIVGVDRVKDTYRKYRN